MVVTLTFVTMMFVTWMFITIPRTDFLHQEPNFLNNSLYIGFKNTTTDKAHVFGPVFQPESEFWGFVASS